MKPVDLRNATWREVQGHITEDMVRVYNAWLAFGPGTTHEVSERSRISLLTLRPRTTDLYKLGLVELVGTTENGRGGVYRHRQYADAEESRAWCTRADFRRRSGEDLDQTFATVEQAIAALTPREQVALAARIMGRWNRVGRKIETNAGTQLELSPA